MAVSVALDRLGDRDPALADRLEDDVSLREALVAVVAASRSLTELCVADPAAVEVLADLARRPPLEPPAEIEDLACWTRL
ncbi:MAG: hypothetical protein ACR2HV_01890 [Acidimicrobiales bacterium]